MPDKPPDVQLPPELRAIAGDLTGNLAACLASKVSILKDERQSLAATRNVLAQLFDGVVEVNQALQDTLRATQNMLVEEQSRLRDTVTSQQEAVKNSKSIYDNQQTVCREEERRENEMKNSGAQRIEALERALKLLRTSLN